MGRPKGLLRFRGRTFLEHILDAIANSRIDHAVVVVGHHRVEIENGFPGLRTVYNAHYEQGMSTSVQAGLNALPQGVTAAALFLVDHPLIEGPTIDSLVSAIEPGRIVLPVNNGRRGHPIVISSELFDEILALSPDQGLNLVVRRDPARVIEVAAPSAGILLDIDTPEDYERLTGTTTDPPPQ